MLKILLNVVSDDGLLYAVRGHGESCECPRQGGHCLHASPHHAEAWQSQGVPDWSDHWRGA